MTPTEGAQAEFKRGIGTLIQVSGQGATLGGLLPMFLTLLQGLDNMAVAQRAIYIKLEEIEKELKKVSNQTRSKTPF